MAARRKSRRRAPVRAGIGQRIAVALAVVFLVLCAASVTFSLFVGQPGDGGSSRPLTLVIRNGSGVAGIAADAETALRELGVDVVDVGNADRFDYPESVLIVRRRNAEAEGLAQRIGCRNVMKQTRRDAIADAELILGGDYRRLSLGHAH